MRVIGKKAKMKTKLLKSMICRSSIFIRNPEMIITILQFEIKAIRLKKKEYILKVVILAGGFGTRISEESHLKPKPMIEIGGRPILWHIMKIYSHYGFHEFIICLGYKGYIIKEYFSNHFLHMSDVT